MNPDLSLIVLSSDKYKPAWSAFYTLFNKYWADFDGQVFHYTESESLNEKNVKIIHSNYPVVPSYWSKGFLYALDNITTEYVIVVLEDIFFNQKISHQKVVEYFNVIKNNPEVKCFRLMPLPPPKIEMNGEYGEFELNQAYRISTQLSIWDKEYLKSLIKLDENPWEFEHQANERAKKMEGKIYGVLRKPYAERIATHINGLIRGKLTRQAKNFLLKEGVSISNQLPVNTWIEEFYWFKANHFTKKIMDFINTRIYKIMWRHKL
jgi:hypothetical protein